MGRAREKFITSFSFYEKNSSKSIKDRLETRWLRHEIIISKRQDISRFSRVYTESVSR